MDVVTVVACTLIAVVARSELLPPLSGIDPFAPVRNYVTLWPAAGILLVGRALSGLYPGYGLHPAEELRRQTTVTLGLAVLVLAGGALFQFSGIYSRIVLVGTVVLLMVALPIVRSLVKTWLARSPSFGLPVWVLGNGERAKTIAELLTLNPRLGLRPIGLGERIPDNLMDVNHCVVIPEGIELPLGPLLDQLNERFRRVWLVPSLLDIASAWIIPRDIQGHLALELRNNLLEPRSGFIKRATDLLLALAVLPIAAPLFLLVALAIRLDSPGPILLRQQRVGKGGKRFGVFKFRSMVRDAEKALERHLEVSPEARAEWNRTRKLVDDPRITRVGRILRRSSLDELPQILNVVVGEMSFVGPRPTMPDEVAWYGDKSQLLMQVLPGITGLTQVSGRSLLTYEERVRTDAYYVRNWSIWLDLVILGRTVGAVLNGTGAY